MTSPTPSSPRQRFELSAEQATSIADAVCALPGVAGLTGGRFGEVTLLYPGQRIAGLRRPNPRDDTHLEIHVVVDLSDLSRTPVLAELAEQARHAALSACPQLRQVDIVLADAATPTHP